VKPAGEPPRATVDFEELLAGAQPDEKLEESGIPPRLPMENLDGVAANQLREL